MSISSIGFQNATRQVTAASSPAVAHGSRDGSTEEGPQGDSLTLSTQSLALFKQAPEDQQVQPGSGHHYRHHLSDDQASQIGAKINQQDPALFKQLDKDGDGKLSAGELKEGIKQLRQQEQEQLSAVTEDASGEAADDDSTATHGKSAAVDGKPAADDLAVIRQAFAAVLGHGAPHTPAAT